MSLTMMRVATASRLLQRSATVRLSRKTLLESFRTNNRVLASVSWFSVDVKPSSSSEKPIIPGVGKGKTSTGLVGLAVEPDWYNVMLKKFQALLDKMEASDMPETAQFRIDVTKWCNYVIKTVKENPDDPEAVEDAVQMGQVEELIQMADDEMVALDVYLESRMWELTAAAHAATIDFNPDPMKDPMAHDGDAKEQESLRKGMEQKKQHQQKAK